MFWFEEIGVGEHLNSVRFSCVSYLAQWSPDPRLQPSTLQRRKQQTVKKNKYYSRNWQLYSRFDIAIVGSMERIKKGKSNMFVPQSSQGTEFCNLVILKPWWPGRRSQRREKLGELFQQNCWMWGILGVSWMWVKKKSSLLPHLISLCLEERRKVGRKKKSTLEHYIWTKQNLYFKLNSSIHGNPTTLCCHSASCTGQGWRWVHITTQTVPATKLVGTLSGTFLLTSLLIFCPEVTVFKPAHTFFVVF